MMIEIYCMILIVVLSLNSIKESENSLIFMAEYCKSLKAVMVTYMGNNNISKPYHIIFCENVLEMDALLSILHFIRALL